MKNTPTLPTICAITWLLAASPFAQVLTTYTNGDVFIGFRRSGTANTLAVNLGSATKFLIPAYGGTATPGVPFKVQFGLVPGTATPVFNLNTDLTGVFASNWTNNTDDGSGVRWAVVGLSGNTTSGIPGYTARTLFVTRARLAPNEPTVIGADRLDIGDFGEFSAAFTAFTQGSGGSQFRFQQSTTNSSVAYIGAASGADNWGTRIDTASEGSFGLGSGVEVEQTFGDYQGTTDSVLDLWISPNTGSTAIPVNQNTYLGNFKLNTAGELIFTPAGLAQQTPYQQWVQSYELTGTNTNVTADPDVDGFDNTLEFGFGTPPNFPNAALLATTAVGTNVVVSYFARTATNEATYNIQSSTNLLAPWTNASGIIVTDAPALPTTPTNYTRKQFTVPASANRFLRIQTSVVNP
jgi:hypothetical protein